MQEVPTFGVTYVLLTVAFYECIKFAFSQAVDADTYAPSSICVCIFYLHFIKMFAQKKQVQKKICLSLTQMKMGDILDSFMTSVTDLMEIFTNIPTFPSICNFYRNSI